MMCDKRKFNLRIDLMCKSYSMHVLLAFTLFDLKFDAFVPVDFVI